MKRETVTIRTPNEQWMRFFFVWLQQMFNEHYNDQDQWGTVITKEDGSIEICILSLDAR